MSIKHRIQATAPGGLTGWFLPAFALRSRDANRAYHIGKHMGLSGKKLPLNPMNAFGVYTRDFLEGYEDGLALRN